MLTLIAAVARNGVIGMGNTIPWHLPEDFKHFKETTQGHSVIMGAKTWDSLPSRFRPLPHRNNIVVSRTRAPVTLAEEGADWVSSIELAIKAAQWANDHDEIFVIGGSSMYAQTIDIADRLLISEVDLSPEGDAFFPQVNIDDWDTVSNREYAGFTVKDMRRKG
jgi:dihydrofolate reductase